MYTTNNNILDRICQEYDTDAELDELGLPLGEMSLEDMEYWTDTLDIPNDWE